MKTLKELSKEYGDRVLPEDLEKEIIERLKLKSKIWRPEIGESYWFVDNCGGVVCTSNQHDNLDQYNILIGNCYKTKGECEFAKQKQLVIKELEDFALENNTKEIDWKNEGQDKWCFYGDYEGGFIGYSYHSLVKQQNTTYFTSKELAKQAVEKVGEDRIKKYLLRL